MRRILWSIGLMIIITITITGCGKAAQFNKNGEKSLTEGDYIKAAECFASAMSINPDKADYHINYGTALIKLGEYDKAISVLDAAYMDKDMSIIKKNNKKILYGKGIAYYHIRQYDNAVKEFEKALEIKTLSELDNDIMLYMAEAYQASGLYTEAVDKLSKLLKQNDKDAFLYAKRAECYKLAADTDSSLSDYEQAIKLEPDKYEYYFAKYNLLEEKGDKAGALAVIAQVEKLEQAADIDKLSKALIQYYQGKYDTALSTLEECHTDGYKEAAYFIAEIYRIRKDYTNAVYYYEKYIADKGTDLPKAYNQIAVSLIKTGDYEGALKYIEKGLANNNKHLDRILRRNEIIIYEYLGRYEEARARLNDYLKDYPDDEEAVREAVFINTRIAGGPPAEE